MAPEIEESTFELDLRRQITLRAVMLNGNYPIEADERFHIDKIMDAFKAAAQEVKEQKLSDPADLKAVFQRHMKAASAQVDTGIPVIKAPFALERLNATVINALQQMVRS